MKYFSFLVFLFSCPILCSLNFPLVRSPEDLPALFPRSCEEVQSKQDALTQDIEASFAPLRTLPEDSLTFENLVAPFSEALAYIHMHISQSQALANVEPQEDLRAAVQNSFVFYQQQYVNAFFNEEVIYEKIKTLYQRDQGLFTQEQKYLTSFILREFESNGFSLSLEEREQVKILQSEMAQLEQQFSSNINEDHRELIVQPEALKGVNPQMLSRLDQKASGEYTLRCDYPSYFSVMTTCENAQTRKDFLTLFKQRAYPSNEDVLNKLIEKRDQYAKALHYESYNHFILSREMAKNPKTVASFLNELYALSAEKSEKEFKEKLSHLPEGIKLSNEGKIYPWDAGYIQSQYEKKFYDVDQEKIAEYFPLEKTFQGLLSIYESFFDIQIQEVKTPTLWHEDLQTLEISERDGTLIGYVILDLFPRLNKYSHACCNPGVAWNYKKGTQNIPGVDVIIANFTKPTHETPSLLKHNEVSCLFHEFGHALHDLFAKNSHPFLSTIQTPLINVDFVELPSQLLENWLWDPAILASISSHYQTHEPLPAETIDRLIQTKNVSSGGFLARQIYLSFLALNIFSEESQKDVKQIAKSLKDRFDPYYERIEQDYGFLSFDHLTEYGPRYYGYLWSAVFAYDVFMQIKKEGLLNSSIGKRYRQTILCPGASKDPNDLLVDFLGRAPQINAYLEGNGL